MLKCVKKIKEIILSSSIFTWISYLNTFGKCCENKCGSEKGDKNITNNNNNKTPDQTPDPDKDPNKKPDKTPDHGKDPNGDKPKEDPLKSNKDDLKNLLNSVEENNNNLDEKDRFSITINPESIDSKDNKNDLDQIKTKLNNINNQIIQKIAEKDQEKAKEIVKNECLELRKDCVNLNKILNLPLKINIDENQINSADYETLGTYKTNLKNLKSSIEIQKNKEIEEKRKLILELKNLNEGLKKNVIQHFFEHKVLETKYDDDINETKTIEELEKIKEELKYILKCPFNNETLGGFDYDIINYDEIMKDLKSINTYRIMNIFYKIVSYGSFYDKQEYRYIIFENKNSLIDPFTNAKATYYKKFFDFIHYILFEYDNFFEELKSLATKTDSNSYFANYLKLLFYTDDRKKTYNISAICDNMLSFIRDFKIHKEENTEKVNFLNENKIKLGDKLNDEDLVSFKYVKLKDLNNHVYEKTENEWCRRNIKL